MKFENLSKEHQHFLMYCLLSYIEGRISKETMDGKSSVASSFARVPGTLAD